MNHYLLGLAGIAAIILIAVAFSSNRKAINFRVVGPAFALQAVLAFLVIKTPWGRAVIQAMSDGVAELLGYASLGACTRWDIEEFGQTPSAARRERRQAAQPGRN